MANPDELDRIDAERITEARRRIPKLMHRLEALEMDRLVFLEARATSEAVRSRNAFEAGKSAAILPMQAVKAAKLISSVIRERRATKRRSAAELTAAEATTHPIAEAA
jgi:hypothetical protein